jgi:hypothetical protein
VGTAAASAVIWTVRLAEWSAASTTATSPEDCNACPGSDPDLFGRGLMDAVAPSTLFRSGGARGASHAGGDELDLGHLREPVADMVAKVLQRMRLERRIALRRCGRNRPIRKWWSAAKGQAARTGDR